MILPSTGEISDPIEFELFKNSLFSVTDEVVFSQRVEPVYPTM
jgi:hypothetical protein